MNLPGASFSLNGFEWWYLQISTPRYSVTIGIHTTEVLGGTLDTPYISVTIFGSRGLIICDRIPFDTSDIRWTQDGFLAIRGQMTESRNGWDLALNSAALSIYGSISRAAPGWRVYDSFLVSDGSGNWMHWSVPMPRGIWKGALAAGKDISCVQHGYAYQDHNWADFPLTYFVGGWSWQVLASNKETVIWAEVQPCFEGIPGLGVSISNRGRMTRITEPPRIRRESSLVVKRRLYRRERYEAAYERAVVRGLASLKPIRGFSERVNVMGSAPAEDAVCGVRLASVL